MIDIKYRDRLFLIFVVILYIVDVKGIKIVNTSRLNKRRSSSLPSIEYNIGNFDLSAKIENTAINLFETVYEKINIYFSKPNVYKSISIDLLSNPVHNKFIQFNFYIFPRLKIVNRIISNPVDKIYSFLLIVKKNRISDTKVFKNGKIC